MSSSHLEIFRLLNENNGYLHTHTFQKKRSFYAGLQQLLKAGMVVKVKSGLYRMSSENNPNEWQELHHIYPDGVFCLYSAWHYYELSTDIPAYHCLAFPNKAKVNEQAFPPIQAFYWSKMYHELEVVELEGIKIYSLEKSICDAIKFRNKIGVSTTATILKNYLKRNDKDMNKLFQISKLMKMNKILREYLNLVS